ncbi:hypothetical protein DFH07DRAFT_780939 [Mycena maculata]|uniref:Uncharacterized protein n=1 Tax=Mycena maculata TaxID=230809 RepID=A0AAD7I0C6_9AGAR|nr:hypothetical protein DFH07DRAFT_780939 [Mycena maculata]
MAWATMMASNIDQTLTAVAERAVEEPTATTEPQEMFRKVEEQMNLSGRLGSIARWEILPYGVEQLTYYGRLWVLKPRSGHGLWGFTMLWVLIGNMSFNRPEFKRISTFQGDYFLLGLRRFFLQHASKTQKAWSWCNTSSNRFQGRLLTISSGVVSKRGKSTPDLGAFHTSDMPMWFPVNATDPMESVAVDALIHFINTLDPNVSAEPRSPPTVFWPEWKTPSANGSGSLLTFSDPAVINVTADDFRVEQMQFLIDLHLQGVTVAGS